MLPLHIRCRIHLELNRAGQNRVNIIECAHVLASPDITHVTPLRRTFARIHLFRIHLDRNFLRTDMQVSDPSSRRHVEAKQTVVSPVLKKVEAFPWTPCRPCDLCEYKLETFTAHKLSLFSWKLRRELRVASNELVYTLRHY